MKKLSFAVAILCGLTQADEFIGPVITYDEKAFEKAMTKVDDFIAKD